VKTIRFVVNRAFLDRKANKEILDRQVNMELTVYLDPLGRRSVCLPILSYHLV